MGGACSAYALPATPETRSPALRDCRERNRGHEEIRRTASAQVVTARQTDPCKLVKILDAQLFFLVFLVFDLIGLQLQV